MSATVYVTADEKDESRYYYGIQGWDERPVAAHSWLCHCGQPIYWHVFLLETTDGEITRYGFMRGEEVCWQ